jgi:hypothetical protein
MLRPQAPMNILCLLRAVAAPEPPPLPPLDVDAVLARLSARDAPLPSILLDRFGGRAGLLQFYARFLRSPNLVAFLHVRRLAAEAWQRQEWQEAAAAVRAPQQELLSVESFFLLGRQLAEARQQQQQQQQQDARQPSWHAEQQRGQHASQQQQQQPGQERAAKPASGPSPDEATLVAQLQQQLRLAFEQLPPDLQQAILHTPSHATLLGDAEQQAALLQRAQAQEAA